MRVNLSASFKSLGPHESTANHVDSSVGLLSRASPKRGLPPLENSLICNRFSFEHLKSGYRSGMGVGGF